MKTFCLWDELYDRINVLKQKIKTKRKSNEKYIL